MADRVGQLLGNYQLTKLLGQGGFAEVYLGEHIYLKTPGAIKLLHTKGASQKELDDFIKEAQAIAKLRHPNIIRVLEFGMEEKTPFLVMDYAPNGTLRQRHQKKTQVPLATVIAYVKQVAAALQYAHDADIIHRDVKPDNMLIAQEDRIWLSDFGIALTAHSSTAISTQDAIGTIAYMAPEQFQGKPRRASDQYALGIGVYEWLAGERPFHGSFAEIGMQHMHTIPAPLREKVPTLAPEIDKVILRALAKDPQERYGSVEEFAKELEQAERASRVPEMPVLLRQPAVARASAMKSTSGEVEAIQPEPRLTKRAGMRVHTQDQPDFSRQDYDAPTSSLDPAMLARKQTNLKNEAALAGQPISKPLAAIAAKRPTRSMLALIPISIILLLLVVGGLTYISFQAGISASVSLTPQIHSMSQTFTITAKPEQASINENEAIIPANALSSSKTGSLQGATSGVTNCQLGGTSNCQKAVSPYDVNFLTTQLKPSLQKQIANDLQNQSGNSDKQLIGSIVYNDDNITSNPGVGSASKTVTVSLTENGSVEYFLKSDTQKLAGELLQQQITRNFGAQYRLIDQYTQMSSASVQNIDNNGVVTISIAAGGIASYQMSNDELNSIQSHIEGMTVTAAQTYIKKVGGINPATIIVSLSAGEKIPTNSQEVTINMLAPNITSLPPVNLPKIKPGIPFSSPA